MPSKPATFCNGCGQPVSGVCNRCRVLREKNRPSSHQRGYGAKWRKLRKYVLSLNPVCAICQRKIACEVDHKLRKADGGSDDITNLQGLCTECHAVKTAMENGKRRGGGV